jgi:hypothetical protein
VGSWFGGGSSLCAPQGQPCKLQDLYYNQLHGITQPCAGPAWPTGLLQSVLDFQRNKQARLNALPSIVRLRLHQVEHVQDDGLGAAQELGASRIVFSRGQLQRLKARAQVGGLLCIMCVFFMCHACTLACLAPVSFVTTLSSKPCSQQLWALLMRCGAQELDNDRVALVTATRELTRTQRGLALALGSSEARLQELKSRCEEVQRLKFGTTIDTRLLDMVGAVNNVKTELLRDGLRAQTEGADRDLAAVDVRIAAKRRTLLELCRANTLALAAVTAVRRAQHSVEVSVAAGGGDLSHEALSMKHSRLEERDRLVRAINENAQVLDGLHASTAALRHHRA